MRNVFLLLAFVSLGITAQKIERVFPEVLSKFPHVRDIAITANQEEIYFTVESYKKEYSFIAFIKKVNNQWTNQKLLLFLECIKT